MIVRSQALFLLLLALSRVQTSAAQQKIVKRRSGFEPFQASQTNRSFDSEPFDTYDLRTDDGSSDLPQERNLSLNSNVQKYLSMVKSGRPIRPIRGGRQLQRDECTLFAEFSPLYYNLLSRSSDFTIAFSSNCLRYTEIGFKVNYRKSRLVNWFMHPTTVHLNLWGNSYKLMFKKQKLIDKFDIVRAFQYSEARISHISNEVTINTEQKNSIYLDPQARNTFNKFNIQKLKNVRGRVDCEMGVRRVRGWKIRMVNRNNFIKMMKSRGETDEAIKKMLNIRHFSPVLQRSQRSERKLNQVSSDPNTNDIAEASKDKKKVQKKGQKKGQKRAQKKKAKKVRQKKKQNKIFRQKRKGSKLNQSDMTNDERRIYEKNRKKMRLRYKREFVKRVEIECVIL